MRAALALVVVVSACSGAAPEHVDAEEPAVTLAVASIFETDAIGDRRPPVGDAFDVVRVTIANGESGVVVVEPEFFELVIEEGRAGAPFAIADDPEACAGARLRKGDALTCNVAFAVEQGALPDLVRYRRGDLVLEASTEVPSFARCLAFEDMLDPDCFTLCAGEACFQEHDDVSASCSQACLESCFDTDDPCLCAAVGCGPGCNDALHAYDACAATCIVVCGAPPPD